LLSAYIPVSVVNIGGKMLDFYELFFDSYELSTNIDDNSDINEYQYSDRVFTNSFSDNSTYHFMYEGKMISLDVQVKFTNIDRN
jgi:hypothetical protein